MVCHFYVVSQTELGKMGGGTICIYHWPHESTPNTTNDLTKKLGMNVLNADGTDDKPVARKILDPRGLGTKTLQQNAVREQVKAVFASTAEIECKFDTLSGAIAKENIQSIGLLKLDAELADWEIFDGIKAEHWSRIRQVAMEVHKSSDVEPISKFFTERGFNHVVGKQLKFATGYVWARK